MRETLRIGGPALFVAVLGALGCGSGTGATGASATGTTTTTTTSAPSICGDDPRVTPYVLGLSAASADGAIHVAFQDADPAPPAKGNNTFMIAVTDGSGQPIDGATIVTKGFMPDHGHALSIKPTTTPADAKGMYEVKPVTLFMPGVWEITFEVTPAGGAMGAVTFSLCIDG